MTELKIKVKLDENAKMPEKAHSSDAGYDLFAPKDFMVPATGLYTRYGTTLGTKVGSATIDTGVHMQIPDGYVGMIKSKSGLNVKHGLIADGTIDANYTGSIVVKLYNLSNEPYQFKKGDKITQIVILELPICTLIKSVELDETERENKGFGSTGR